MYGGSGLDALRYDDGDWVLWKVGSMVVVVLHIDVQLHKVAAGKSLGEVGHLHVQRVPRALLIVQLADQVHVTLQTVHHEGPVPVCTTRDQVGHLTLQGRGWWLVWRADRADDRARRSSFDRVQGHEEHVWLLVGPGRAENLRGGNRGKA